MKLREVVQPLLIDPSLDNRPVADTGILVSIVETFRNLRGRLLSPTDREITRLGGAAENNKEPV